MTAHLGALALAVAAGAACAVLLALAFGSWGGGFFVVGVLLLLGSLVWVGRGGTTSAPMGTTGTPLLYRRDGDATQLPPSPPAVVRRTLAPVHALAGGVVLLVVALVLAGQG